MVRYTFIIEIQYLFYYTRIEITMSFNKDAESHWKCLEKIGVLEKIYEVMRKNDFAELTLAVLDILKQSNTIIKYVKESKSENKSDEFRKEGNKAYGAQQYRSALDYYNRALLHAPDNSKAMTLAYSNRSVLLFKFQAYTACLKDIETCFAMECSKDIAEKLNTRKEKCLKLLWREEALFPNDSQDYFKFDTPHPDVPCVSTDVDFIRRNNVPTVIAAKDIKIGTIIAVEPAFSTLLNPKNQYLSCFYCQKMSLNLKPCKGCCFSLFCDDKCKDLCMEETHKIECRFMHALNNLCFTQRSILTFRAILRIKHLCKTWKEFITASYHVGEERLKSSTLNQIYDRNDPFSMLCFSEKREINFGSCYNYAFMCATFLDRLMYTPGFFPYLIKERNVAIRAVARMTMKLLLLFYNKIDLPNAALDCETLQYNVLAPNHGYFTFASKLKHCCDANLQIIALNNKLALMALHPIKKGKELTISYV